MMKHFYLFRHGETDLNAAGRFQGQSCNIGLNSTGRRQAEDIVCHLQDKNIQVVFSSPLLRALETAEIVAKDLGVSVNIDRHFIEGNFGDVEGKTRSDLTAEEAAVFADWVRQAPEFLDVHFKGGESKRQIQARVLNGLKKAAQTPYDNIAVSTHSSVLRVIMQALGCFWHQIPHAQPFHVIWENGVFRLADDGKILLLSCCAPCSCAVIEKMALEKRKFSVVFYNPNIIPYSEYQKRCEENERVCQQYHIDFIELEYDNELWKKFTCGLENEPERGRRCSLCFYMRLQKVMAYALINGFDAVASVLGVSRWKDLDQVNRMADLAAKRTGCPYILIEGRKGGMQQRRSELIRSLALYNQTYCGCKPE